MLRNVLEDCPSVGMYGFRAICKVAIKCIFKIQRMALITFSTTCNGFMRFLGIMLRLSRSQKIIIMLTVAIMFLHMTPLQQRQGARARDNNKSYARWHQRARYTTQRSNRCRRSKITIRACHPRRGDRHFDMIGGISGSFLHPKTSDKKAAYMSKQGMTYWQHLRTLNSECYEGLLTLTDQCSNEESPNETYLCNHKIDDKQQKHKKRFNAKCGRMIMCLVMFVAGFACCSSGCYLSDYGSLS